MAKQSKFGAILAAIAILIALGLGVMDAFGVTFLSEYSGVVTGGLVVLGILLGLFNISKAESVPFMVAGLVIAGGATALAVIPFAGEWIQVIFAKVAMLIIPAAIIVAIAVAYEKLSK